MPRRRGTSHGVRLDAIRRFEWDGCMTREDSRGAYGERRFVSIGGIDSRLHVVVWTAREARRRIISLRKANPRGAAAYGRG